MGIKKFRNIDGNDINPLWIPTNVGRYAPTLEESKWINLDSRFGQAPNYQEYVALLTQTGTNAPTAVVLNQDANNYLGNIVWTYDDVGAYIGTLTGMCEDPTKVFLQISITNTKVGADLRHVEIYAQLPILTVNDDDSVYLLVLDQEAKAYVDEGITSATVVIRKYN